MAELAVGILGLATTAEVVFKRIHCYITDIKNAEREVIQLSVTVTALYGTLHGVSLITGEFASEGAVSQVYGTQIAACHAALDRLSKKLAKHQSDCGKEAKRTVKRSWQWPLTKCETTALCKELEGYKATLSFALTVEGLATSLTTLQAVQSIAANVELVRDVLESRSKTDISQEDERLLARLAPHSPQNHLQSNLKLRHPGTGTWFLQSRPMQRWMSSQSDALWIYGIPGAGKSVLAAASISYAFAQQRPDTVIAYYFCDFKSPESLRVQVILGSIVEQICRQSKECYRAATEVLRHALSNDTMQTSSLDTNHLADLLSTFADIVDGTSIIIDGLDECGELVRETVGELSMLQSTLTNLKMMLFSRDIPDIRDFLEDWDCFLISAETADLKLYVAAEVAHRTDRRARRRLWVEDPLLKGEIIDGLVEGAKGMFRWAAVALDYFCELASDAEIRFALGSLPPGLHESYERLLSVFSKRPPSTQVVIQRALQWVIGVGRFPANMIGTALALAADDGRSTSNVVITDERILTLTGSLLRKSEDDGFLEPAHFTVKEYLTSDAVLLNPCYKIFALTTESVGVPLTISALRCMLQLEVGAEFQAGPTQEQRLKIMDDQHPFRAFIRCKWPDWAAAHWDDAQVLSLGRQLFEPDNIHTLRSWVVECTTHCMVRELDDYDTGPIDWLRGSYTAVDYSAILSFDEICRELLEAGFTASQSRNGTNGIPIFKLCMYAPTFILDLASFEILVDGTSPSSWLSRLDRTSLVLIEHGLHFLPGSSEINPEGYDMAISLGCEKTCRELFSLGMLCSRKLLKRLERQLRKGGRPAASAENIIRSMSRHNVRPNDEPLLTKLQTASSVVGTLPVSERSQSNGASDLASNHALCAAIKLDDPHGLRIILQRDLNSLHWKDEEGSGLMEIAVSHGSHRVIEALMEHGMTVSDSSDRQKVVLLHIAARNLRASTIELFCTYDALLLAADEQGHNILHAFNRSELRTKDSRRRLDECVQWIRSRLSQDEIDSLIIGRNNQGLCPVIDAGTWHPQTRPRWRHLRYACSLQPSAPFQRCGLADIVLVSRGNKRAAAALIGLGADEWIRGPQSETLLHYAASSSSPKLVQMLIERGHSPLQTDQKGRTALAYAAAAFNRDALSFVYLYDASPETLLLPDADGETPLDLLFTRYSRADDDFTYDAKFEEIVQSLVESHSPAAIDPLFQALASCPLDRQTEPENVAAWLEELEKRGVGQLDSLQVVQDLTRHLDNLQEHIASTQRRYTENALVRMICVLIRCLPEGVLRNVRSKGRQILTIAIQTVNRDLARAILDVYVDIDTADDVEGGPTPLHALCKTWTPRDVAEKILAAAKDASDAPLYPGQNERYRDTLLTSAAKHAPKYVISALLEKGHDVNGRDSEGGTPLMAAVWREEHDAMEIFDLLLSRGADTQLKNIDGWSVAHEAAYAGNLPVLKHRELRQSCWRDKCKHTAKSRDEEAWNLLQLAVYRGHHEVVVYLLGLGLFDLDDQVGSLSLLDLAALGGSSTVVRHLLKLERDWTTNWKRESPLHLAVLSGSVSTTTLLLDEGYSLNAPRGDGLSPLSLAIRERKVDLISLFERHLRGRNNILDGKIDNALKLIQRNKFRVAIEEGNVALCRTLLSSEPLLQAACSTCGHCDPLIQALHYRQEEVALLLINKGARVSGRSCSASPLGGFHALQICATRGLPRAMGAIMDRCAWLLFVYCEAPPLHLAICHKETECIRIMLERSPRLWASIPVFIGKHTGDPSSRQRESSSVAAARDMSKLLPSTNLILAALSWYKLGRLFPDSRGLPRDDILPIHTAIYANNTEALDLLLGHGAVVDEVLPDFCSTALHYAIKLRRLNIVKTLLRAGANRQLCDYDGVSCEQLLLYAPDFEKLASVNGARQGPSANVWEETLSEQLLMRSSNLWHLGATQWDRSVVAKGKAGAGWPGVAIDCVLNAGKDISSLTAAFGGILHARWKTRHFNDVRNICKYLGRQQAEQHLNFKPEHCFTPLYYAVIRNALEIAKVYLRFGANPDLVGGPDGSALMAAAVYGRLEMVKLFIRAGATVCYRDQDEDGKLFSVYEKARFFPEIRRWLLVERWTEVKRLTWEMDA